MVSYYKTEYLDHGFWRTRLFIDDKPAFMQVTINDTDVYKVSEVWQDGMTLGLVIDGNTKWIETKSYKITRA